MIEQDRSVINTEKVEKKSWLKPKITQLAVRKTKSSFVPFIFEFPFASGDSGVTS